MCVGFLTVATFVAYVCAQPNPGAPLRPRQGIILRARVDPRSLTEELIARQGPAGTPSSPAIQPSVLVNCQSSCNDTADSGPLSAGANCSTNATCLCDVLGALTANCLDCVITQVNLTAGEYSGLYPDNSPTTPNCTSQCSDPADQAAAAALEDCPTERLANNECVCAAGDKMSQLCWECLLVSSNLTVSDWQSNCGSIPENNSTITSVSTVPVTTPGTPLTPTLSPTTTVATLPSGATTTNLGHVHTSNLASPSPTRSSTALSFRLRSVGTWFAIPVSVLAVLFS